MNVHSTSTTSRLSPATRPGLMGRAGMVLGRSFLPLLVVILLAGTLVWGPWVTLLLAIVCWQLAGRVW